ncbi:MAG: hypothetical protein ACI4AE_00995 [Candidatus Cryptobacteroides sp.]
MRIKLFSISIALSAVVLAGCSSRRNAGGATIRYVERILSDTTSAVFKSFSTVTRDDVAGSITVIGSPREAFAVTEGLLTYDIHNNISGIHRQDGLPDFSGEVIAPLVDIANTPYSDYLSLGNEAFLKELNVRNFLWAMDTVAFQSPFNTDVPVFKQKSKIVVFASSYASVYGYREIDTLCTVAKSVVPVFAPVQAMAEYVFSRREGPQRIAAWVSPKVYQDGIYQSALARELSSRGDAVSAFSVISPEADSLNADVNPLTYRGDFNVRTKFLNLLDRYMEAGVPDRLTCLMLDDVTVPPDALRQVVDEIMNTDEDNMLVYRNILAPGFEVVTPVGAIAELCYSYLRKYNLFTHRIAYPDMKPYVTAPEADLNESDYDVDGSLAYAYKYSRAEDRPSPGYVVVQMRDRYVSDAILDMISKQYPKTFSLYVR